MSIDSFIHLRVHSAYSLAEGAIRIKDLVKRCKLNGKFAKCGTPGAKPV